MHGRGHRGSHDNSPSHAQPLHLSYTRASVEAAIHAIDNSWATWMGRPDVPCPSGMGPIVHVHSQEMGAITSCSPADNCPAPGAVGSPINLKMAAAHTAAVVSQQQA